MVLVIYGVIGMIIGCLVLVGILNHQFRSRHYEDIQDLITQSKERQNRYEQYGKKLDKMLED